MPKDLLKRPGAAGNPAGCTAEWLCLAILFRAAACAAALPYSLAQEQDAGAIGDCSEEDISTPPDDTPRAIREAWLRFHEEKLCLDLDAVFAFHPEGVEVWCLIDSEKSYEKFARMLEPLKSSYQIGLYATRPPVDKKAQNRREPPPSLWNNSALLDYLRDPFRSYRARPSELDMAKDSSRRQGDLVLKQRLLMFAERILDWNKEVRRFGAGLPALARGGFGPQAPPDLRARMAAACLEHAQALDKSADRLIGELEPALPRPLKRVPPKSETKEARPETAPGEIAGEISRTSLAASRSVYRFIFPREHTVGVMDLREAGLLEPLRELRDLVAELKQAAEKAH